MPGVKKPKFHLVGFQVSLEDSKDALLSIPELQNMEESLKWKVFTTVMYQEQQADMAAFFTRMTRKPSIEGYIRAIYTKQMGKVKISVAEITILSSTYFITLVNEYSGCALQTLKAKASSGELGDRIELDPKVVVKILPYAQAYADDGSLYDVEWQPPVSTETT